MKKVLKWILAKFEDDLQDKQDLKDRKDNKEIDPRQIKSRLGQRKEKVVFAFVVWLASFSIILFFSTFFFGFLYGSLMCLALWLKLFEKTSNFFLVSVPKVGGLVATNLYDGFIELYDVGIHFKYPWEQVENDHYISMRLVNETYPKTFPTNDGPEVDMEWTLQYNPTISGLARFISVDISKIKGALGAVGNSYLSDRTAIKTAEESREAVKELEAGLKMLFEKTPAEVREIDKEMFLKNLNLYEKKLNGYDTKDIEEIREKIEEMNKKIEKLNMQIEDSKKNIDLIPKGALNDMIYEHKKEERELETFERELKKAQNGASVGIKKQIEELETKIHELSEKNSNKDTMEEKRIDLINLKKEEAVINRAIDKIETRLMHLDQSISVYDQAKLEQETNPESPPLIDDCVLESIYGIDLRISSLSGTTFEKRYQEIRTTKKISKELAEMANRAVTDSKDDKEPITRKEAYNNLLVINKSATKDILDTSAGNAGDALASLFRAFGSFRKEGR